jgi:hypothetical protein
MRGSKKMIRALTLALTAALFLSIVSLAAAEESREGYIAKVEPICQANSKANEKILKPVKKEVTQNKLALAAKQLDQAAKALKTTEAELEAVEQPPADAAKLSKWLGYVKTEASLFEQTGRALKSNNKNKAQQLESKLNANANSANAEVLSFSFHYCRFEPSKYT